VPAGTYKVTGTLRVWSVTGLAMRGDSHGGTTFRPVGMTGDLIDINGACWCLFADFAVAANPGEPAVLADVIMYRWDQTTAARSTSGCVFRNINVYQTPYRIGLRVGRPGDTPAGPQIDVTLYDNLIFDGGPKSTTDLAAVKGYADTPAGYAGSWLCAFYVGNGTYGNIINHTFTNCHAGNVLVAHYTDRASVLLHDFTASGVVIPFVCKTVMNYLVDDAYTEDSGTMAYFPNDTSQPFGAEFRHVHVNTATAVGELLSVNGAGGVLTLSNCMVTAPDAGSAPAVNWNPAWPSVLHLDRVRTPSTPAQLLGGLGAMVTLGRFDSYTQQNMNNGTVVRTTGVPRVTLAASGTLATWQSRVTLDPTPGAFTATLPPVANVPGGYRVEVRNVANNGNAAALAAGAGETFDGVASPYSLAARHAVTLESDGTNWVVADSFTF
jgi:hypothetical protein